MRLSVKDRQAIAYAKGKSDGIMEELARKKEVKIEVLAGVAQLALANAKLAYAISRVLEHAK